MDFLYKYGLTEEDVREITERNGEAIVKNVILNKDNDEYEIDSIIKSLNYDVNTVDLIEFS